MLALSLLLSACGGGGGGGATPPQEAGDPGSGFRVSLSLNTITAQAEEGMALAPIVVTGIGNGPAPATLFLGTTDLGSAIDHVKVEGTGADAKFTVFVKSGLPVGLHEGRLQFLACRDEKCTSHFAGSPVSVPYVITITRGLRVTPNALRFSVLSGLTQSADVVLQLPAGQSSAVLEPTVPWLAVSNQSQAGFTVTTKAMPPGQYQGSVTVTVAGRSSAVTVDYHVVGDASTVTSIIPDQASMSLSALTTGSTSGLLNVTLPSWSKELVATVQPVSGPSDWLRVARDGERRLDVTALAGTLPAGTYQANIVLSSGPGVPTVTVPVTFTVGVARWTIHGTTAFAVRPDTTAEQLASTLLLNVPGLPGQAYSASTTSPWLRLSHGAGRTDGTPLLISVDTAEMLKLPNFRSHTAEIAIVPGASALPPLKVMVTLDKALPELNYVSPHTRLPNEGGVYTLRGRGLDKIVDLANVLQVSGATPSQLTLVNDTTIRISLPGSASGDVGFALKNSLGIPAGSPVLSVVPQPAFSYAAISTPGEKAGLVFNAQRQSLYSVDRTQQAVMRYSWNGSRWDVTTTPLQYADSVALSPDGKLLVAVTLVGKIVLFDPSTMAVQGSYEAGPPQGTIGYKDGTQRLAVTNDGRAWYSMFHWRGLPYFDLVTRERGLIAEERHLSYGDGPWYSVSGDGSRLNIALDSFGAPTEYLDGGDGKLRTSPSGYSYWRIAPQSLRGERFVEEQGRVLDRNFNLVGTLVDPDPNYAGQVHAVSPDGSRVYMLTYHYSYGRDGLTPRVYVFDSSTPMAPDTALPVLGYFDIADFPTCHSGIVLCNRYAIGTTSPDGKTLFFIGNEKLVVAPIPVLTPIAPATSAVSGRAMGMTRMPLGR